MITFSNVSLIYPYATKTVIEDLSFTIDEGEMVLVMGHTGIGKSSVLRLINGLIPHHTGGLLAGDVSVDGISTSTVRPGELAHLIGIVGQNPSQSFVADIVEEELAFGMEALNFAPDVMRRRVEEVLDQVGLHALRTRQISTLSGGEQQRLAIGAALVMHPKVLVLDEPTSALDPVAAEEVLSLLHRLVHDLSITVVISEHRLERVIQFVDRILLIEDGGNFSIGNPQTILGMTELVPPIVQLSRKLALPEIHTTVRELRRATEGIRDLEDVMGEKTVSDVELLTLETINFNIDGNSILKDINISLYANEILAVMGRNGAGKSSLLKTITGSLQPKTGTRTPRKNDLKIGYVPQEPGDILYKQSIEAECLQNDKDASLITGTTLELFKRFLPDVSPKTHPHDLSEGQRLILVLSIVISTNPDLLILDEPTRGLDYVAKSLLVEILEDFISHGGRSVVLATHDVELAAVIASKIAIIAEGELVSYGMTTDVLLASPAFAPQVAKVMAPRRWLTVADVLRVVDANGS
jgi:energy-coupling factor transport system ATP-binding protein